MTDQYAPLDAGLERVISAARAHLVAVKAAEGRIDDDEVWRAYVALNNATYEYDEQLMDAFGEVTPWDVDAIDPDEADRHLAGGADGDPDAAPADPYPHVLSVRQRRDFRVPSAAALIRAAERARLGSAAADGDSDGPVGSVGEAVLELLQCGDGSLAALDIPELEPADGVVAVLEVGRALDLEDYPDADGAGPFVAAGDDRLIGRLDEHPFTDLDDARPA